MRSTTLRLSWFGLLAGLLAAVPVTAAPAAGRASSVAAKPSDLSGQERRAVRRSPTRIIVRRPPLPIEAHPYLHGMRRECVPTFRERYIPQWGGMVLSASQRCWWTPGE